MPLRARVVLADCGAAYEELRQTADPDVFRRRWVAVVTLLRAVGNVLANVDSAQSAVHGRVIRQYWRSDSKPEIFGAFIEHTRGSTIKQYRSGAFLLVDPSTSPMSEYEVSVASETEGGESSTAMAAREASIRLGAPIPYVFKDGPFAQRSVYEVIEEAIEYWENYLSSIEQEVEAAHHRASKE
jgi:hypothetical protein